MKKLICVTACLTLSFLMIFAGCKEAAKNIETILSEIEKTSFDEDVLSEIEQNENERTENRKEKENVSVDEEKKKKKPEETESEPAGEQGEYKSYCYSFLNRTQKEYYKKMVTAVKELNADKVIVGAEDEDDDISDNLSLAFTSLLADHPEFFWLKGRFKTFVRSDTREVYIQFSYLVESGEELEKMQNELNKTAEKLLDATDCMTPFEKEVYFHDYLCKTVDYEKNDGFCHTVYGALVEKKSVCEGYSKAMQWLLNLSDINCVTVRGEDEEGYAHMWNKVELSGEWYALDVTWDDPVNTEKTSYNYFNLTDKEMEKTHITDKTYTADTLPETFDDLEYNFCLPEARGKYYRAEKIGK